MNSFLVATFGPLYTVKTTIYRAMRVLASVYQNTLTKTAITLEKPLFIWGTGRCGTYLLFDILSLHPDLCCSRTTQRWKKGLWGDLHYEDSTPEALRNFLPPIEGTLLIWSPAGAPDVLKGCVQRNDPRINATKVIRNYRNLKRQSIFAPPREKKSILDKSPYYTMMVDFIDNLFPDSYHVFCIRDPRVVVNSMLRMMRETAPQTSGKEYADGFWGKLYPNGYKSYLQSPLVETLCWQIEQLLEMGIGYRFFLGSRLIAVRYEDLVEDVKGVSSHIFKRAQLPEPEIYHMIPGSFKNYVPDWPANDDFKPGNGIYFTQEEKRHLDALSGIAVKLGYKSDQPGVVATKLNF